MKKTIQTLKLRLAIILILMSVSFLVSAQWVKKANTLKPRSEIGSVAYNGKVYVFLGFHDNGLNPELSSEVYNPATNSWKLLSSIPLSSSETHMGVALIDDKVWLIGGRLGKNPGPLSSQIWIYNITNNSWSKGPQITDPATGDPLLWAAGGAAFLGRTLHIFGGFIIDACNHDQDSYHLTINADDWQSNPNQPNLWKNVLAPLPVKRNHFGTVVLGGKIYAIGGQFGHDCGGGQDQSYSHVYNPSTDTWTQLTTLPNPRSHIEGGTFAIDGKIYLVGGQEKNGGDTKQVTILDPAGNSGKGSWTDATSLALPTIYEGISAKVINSTFIISHGGAGDSRFVQNTTYSRSISRKPVYKLGFPAECINLDDSQNGSLKANTWLYTIDGTKNYSTSSSASWLKVTKNATGTAIPNAVDIEVTANTQGLSNGKYNATVTATGTGGGTSYTAAKLCVNLTVQQGQPVTFNLVVTSNGDGTVDKNPDQDNYDNGTTVILTASPGPGQQFTGWSGSASGTANPLSVIMNANKAITATFEPIGTPDLITNLTVNSTRSYVIDQLETGVTYYTDRTYTVTSVPDFLNLAPFIKPPNDDYKNTSSSFIQFNLTQSATLYVAYDPRATALPAWLNGWQKSTSILGIVDNSITFLNLYSKTYPAGKVILGGNLASPAAGSHNNYIVIALAPPAQNRAANAKIEKVENKTDISLQKKQFTGTGLKIFPNPFDGSKLKVEVVNLPKHQNLSISISDVFGNVYQTVKETTDETGAMNRVINFDRVLARGMYILKINSSSFTKCIKVVVN